MITSGYNSKDTLVATQYTLVATHQKSSSNATHQDNCNSSRKPMIATFDIF
jgi:hypothetical protein